MNLAYDAVIERAIETCETMPAFQATVEHALLVRTPTGQVRLVLQLAEGETVSALVREVETELSRALGKWLLPPVISPVHGPRGLRQLAKHLLDQAEARVLRAGWSEVWPPGWPTQSGRAGAEPVALALRWRAHPVTVGKATWLPGPEVDPVGAAPWEMLEGEPRITAFYGFKGGVARTTTLAILAWQLAAQGRRVVCVDLDLEAPGLSRALLEDDQPADGAGVMDELLTHAATGSGLPKLPLSEVTVHGVQMGMVPAGVLGPTYLEKLARLDTMHRGAEKSPVHTAMESLLKRIRATNPRPDHILLDCRSGLHDLAGLALHDLAHVDVFVGRGDRQELDGLAILLAAMVRRRKINDRRMLFLRTFQRMPFEPVRLAAHRDALYALLSAHLYAPDDLPDPLAEGSAHDAVPIGERLSIANARWLGDTQRSDLAGEDFTKVRHRLEALWAAERG